MIWQKIVILGLALLAALWLMIAYGVAYQRTGIRQHLFYCIVGLIILLISGRFALLMLLDPIHPSPSIVLGLVILFFSGSQVVSLWFANDKYPRYRHSRDLLLLRPPQAVSTSAPNPAQGLYVPHAEVPHTWLSLRKKLTIVALSIWMGLVMVMLWFL